MGRYAYSATSAEDSVRGASDRKKVFVVSVLAIQKLKTSMSAERQREGKSMGRMIDVDALIDIIGEMQGLCQTKAALVQNSKIWQQVKNMPIIEERKGKWIPYLSHGLTVMCSKCGSRFDRPWHYCPNCGAKMEHNEDDQNV